MNWTTSPGCPADPGLPLYFTTTVPPSLARGGYLGWLRRHGLGPRPEFSPDDIYQRLIGLVCILYGLFKLLVSALPTATLMLGPWLGRSRFPNP